MNTPWFEWWKGSSRHMLTVKFVASITIAGQASADRTILPHWTKG